MKICQPADIYDKNENVTLPLLLNSQAYIFRCYDDRAKYTWALSCLRDSITDEECPHRGIYCHRP